CGPAEKCCRGSWCCSAPARNVRAQRRRRRGFRRFRSRNPAATRPSDQNSRRNTQGAELASLLGPKSTALGSHASVLGNGLIVVARQPNRPTRDAARAGREIVNDLLTSVEMSAFGRTVAQAPLPASPSTSLADG